MASTIALRRATTPSLLNPVHSVMVVPPIVRSFNTNAQMRNYDDDEHGVNVNVLDPFSPTRMRMLYVRMDMPGLGKENVKGEGEKESNKEKSWQRYNSRINLPKKLYMIYQIKAEMKNGILKVIVPKVKEEDRKDVFQVKID
uniref:SHSP domain-containing protein n=1 Tax=Nelumbo nucifera TaxID=4432 RepID=A0A822YLB3_NELNU|nr:TPA_asm: hypothetical protein HUJ06_012163 [Nelumbo nucifera]